MGPAENIQLKSVHVTEMDVVALSLSIQVWSCMYNGKRPVVTFSLWFLGQFGIS